MLFSKKISTQTLDFIGRKISWGNWFVFFNTIWAILIGSRYAFLIDWPDTLGGKVYFFVSLIGHFSFIVFALYLLILFPLAFVIKNQRTYRGVSVIFFTLALSLLMVDTEVFKNFHFHLSNLIWNLVANPDNGKLARQWQIFFAPMPLILLGQMVYSRWSWEKLRSLERQTWLKFVAYFYACMFLITHLAYVWADANNYRPVVMQQSNFPLSYPMTARKFLQRHGLLKNTIATPQHAYAFLKLAYPKHFLVLSPNFTPKNILIININGLTQANVQTNALTNLNQVLTQAISFTNHYSSATQESAGWFSLLYSLLPQYRYHAQLQKTSPELLNVLRQRGYQSCFMGNQLNLPWINLEKCSSLPSSKSKPWFVVFNATLPKEMKLQQNLDLELKKLLNAVDLTNTSVIITSVVNQPTSNGFIHKSPLFLLNSSTLSKEPPTELSAELATSKEINRLTSILDIAPTILQDILGVENKLSDYAQGQNLFHSDYANVIAQTCRLDIIILPKGEQYQINQRGDYRKLNALGKNEAEDTPSLGLLLNVYKTAGAFWNK